MKKNPLFFVLIFLSILSTNIFSQGFTLFNPSNETYLFSAYNEGANAFRYNPAVLGLSHKFNASVNFFLQNYYNDISLFETDISLNAGNFGIGFRGADINFGGDPSIPGMNEYSIGFGFGTKTLSAGMFYQYLNFSTESYKTVISEDISKHRFGFGLLFRPSDFLSTAFTYKWNQINTKNYQLCDKYTFGIGVRPLRNKLFNVLFDFSFFPHTGIDFYTNYTYKLGIECRVTKGIKVNAQYMKTKNEPEPYEQISFGASFDFPHFSFGYNNPLPKYERNSSSSFYKSYGNHFSFSYSMERKESIIPEPKKIVEIVLSGSLQDYNTEDVFFGILGKGKRSVHEVIADIDYAAADPSVKGMLLKIYPLATGRFEVNAAIEELTASLERFKSKKKSITAYLPQDTGPAEYYIATYANDIVLPSDALFFYGLSIEVFNYKQFLSKFGIELQNFYAGEYKLTFQGILDSTSAQGKEVINRILDVVYEKMMSRTVTARNLVLDDFMRDKLSKPITGMEAQRLGLVDKNGWYDDAINLAEKNSKTKNITGRINRSEWDDGWGEPEQIAIIGVYGTIKPGESEGPSAIVLPIPYIGGGRSTGSETVLRQLEAAFANPKVRAIILRVDSGGGSALAASEISDAIIRLRKKYKKPFIVSMGNAAASGGYYVSVNADRIFSDDLTVTGSIGVWTSRPNLDSLMKDQKLKVEIFKRGENSDIGSFYRKLNEEDVEIIQGIIDFYYDRFIETVSKGRKLTKDEAEQFAKGRVWLGTDAFSKKLVDEIGGLYQAINYAKKKSKIDSKRYNLVYYAVPGGNTVNDLVTQSVLQYLQTNLLNMVWPDEEEQGIEIKY